MAKLKIAMVCPFFLPVVGGMEKHVYNLSLELQKMGHEVVVFTSAIDHSGKAIDRREEAIDGILVKRYKPWFRIGKFASFFPGFIRDLSGFDIIHAHNLRHPHVEFSLWASKIKGTPMALTPHSPYHEGARGIFLEAAKKIYDKIQNIYPIRFIDRIFALHGAEKKWLMERGVDRRKITIVPNGIEERFFATKGTKKQRKEIIFVGRLSKSKGLDLLLKSFSIMETKGWKLRLVGPDGGAKQGLVLLAKNLRISGNVIFEGEISDKRLIFLLDNAGIFALPSRYEPFGISLVEAMARGKACIAIDSGGPREIISNGKDGILVEYDDKALAKAIDSLANSAQLRVSLGARAIKTAGKYRWAKIAGLVEKAYKELVQGK